MSVTHTGNIQPQLDLEEHFGTLDAKRVVLIDKDTGSAYNIDPQTPFTTYVSTTVTLTSAGAAEKLPTSELSSRKCLVIHNKSSYDIYWGSDSVTTSNGILLEAGEKVAIRSESGIYGVCGTDSVDINILECK